MSANKSGDIIKESCSLQVVFRVFDVKSSVAWKIACIMCLHINLLENLHAKKPFSYHLREIFCSLFFCVCRKGSSEWEGSFVVTSLLLCIIARMSVCVCDMRDEKNLCQRWQTSYHVSFFFIHTHCYFIFLLTCIACYSFHSVYIILPTNNR